VAREAISQPYARAAEALNEDWGTDLHGKQIERWATSAGDRLLAEQADERRAYEQGRRPAGPLNDPPLLVIGMDGGRVQGREQRQPDGSRWREDKVLSITSYLPGEPAEEKDPRPLVSSYLATMHDSREFGVLARLEAERRGIRQAPQVVVIGDGANWIDTLHQQHFSAHPRIIDWYHAAEHLHDVAKAAHPDHEGRQKQLAQALKDDLWHGRRRRVIERLEQLAERAGPPRENDPPNHPRRTLAANVGYFQRHRGHMNYPAYRRRGWPIGSGMAESGVKQFNKRVKGTEQFWSDRGVEPILALRALWLSNDPRWTHYWSSHQYLRAAA
jgi:hypothetical protein